MADIDLVPGLYRSKQQLRSRLQQILFASGILIALILAAVVLLRFQNGMLEDGLRELQHAKAISSQQSANLLDLNRRKTEITRQYDLLSGLRSGAAAVEMLRTVDGAMSDSNVWFTDWKFRRAGSKAPISGGQQPLKGNYFVLTTEDQAPARQEAWMIETNMKIDGEAMDHAALSDFVSRLVDQAEIQSVRVIRTETFFHEQRELIRFSLDVVVAWPMQEAAA